MKFLVAVARPAKSAHSARMVIYLSHKRGQQPEERMIGWNVLPTRSGAGELPVVANVDQRRWLPMLGVKLVDVREFGELMRLYAHSKGSRVEGRGRWRFMRKFDGEHTGDIRYLMGFAVGDKRDQDCLSTARFRARLANDLLKAGERIGCSEQVSEKLLLVVEEGIKLEDQNEVAGLS